MTAISHIKAPSLRQAVQIAHESPAKFQFTNSWFVDNNRRLRIFFFDNQAYVAKRVTIAEADKEVQRAKMACQLLEGSTVYAKTLHVMVPHGIALQNNTRECYLVSEYCGQDMNEQYYAGTLPSLSLDEYVMMLKTLLAKGIRYDGFLPRNTIVTKDKIILIDWEAALFYGQAIALDELARTSLVISWSYLFGFAEVMEALDRLPSGRIPDISTIGYEQVFGELTSFSGQPDELRALACHCAIAAEANHTNISGNYKLDDVFHVLSEVLPGRVEVLLDILLAGKKHVPADYRYCAMLLSSLVSRFQANEHAINKRARLRREASCLIILILDQALLMHAQSRQLDYPAAVRYVSELLATAPAQQKYIQHSIYVALTAVYPGAKSGIRPIRQTASDIMQMAAS